MKQANFRTISGFDDEDVAVLGRQVAQLETNVGDAVKQVLGACAAQLAPTAKKTSTYTAALDELVVCAGTFLVILPAPASANAGRTVGILVQSGTVTVKPTSGLVQGATSEAIATVGVSLYMSDGVGWWRVRG